MCTMIEKNHVESIERESYKLVKQLTEGTVLTIDIIDQARRYNRTMNKACKGIVRRQWNI